MSQAYVDLHCSQIQKTREQLNATSEALQAIEDIPFNFNSNNSEIKSSLLNYSHNLISPIVEKATQQLRITSKQLPSETIKQVGDVFLYELQTIVQNFEKNLILLTTKNNTSGEYPRKDSKNQEDQSTSDIERPITENLDNGHDSVLHDDLQYSNSNESGDDEADIDTHGEPTEHEDECNKHQDSTMHQGNNERTTGTMTNPDNESAHSSKKKQKISPMKIQISCPIPHCHKSYGEWFNLSKHIKNNHPNLGTSCPHMDCPDKTFENNDDLLKHLRRIHVILHKDNK